jgi:hypothetical protein
MWGVKIGSVKTGRVRIGARHAWLDKQALPPALRPVQVLLLSAIAGMAHSTLESGAATRNGVAIGASAEESGGHRHRAIRPKDQSPVIV